MFSNLDGVGISKYRTLDRLVQPHPRFFLHLLLITPLSEGRFQEKSPETPIRSHFLDHRPSISKGEALFPIPHELTTEH